MQVHGACSPRNDSASRGTAAPVMEASVSAPLDWAPKQFPRPARPPAQPALPPRSSPSSSLHLVSPQATPETGWSSYAQRGRLAAAHPRALDHFPTPSPRGGAMEAAADVPAATFSDVAAAHKAASPAASSLSAAANPGGPPGSEHEKLASNEAQGAGRAGECARAVAGLALGQTGMMPRPFGLALDPAVGSRRV